MSSRSGCLKRDNFKPLSLSFIWQALCRGLLTVYCTDLMIVLLNKTMRLNFFFYCRFTHCILIILFILTEGMEVPALTYSFDVACGISARDDAIKT